MFAGCLSLAWPVLDAHAQAGQDDAAALADVIVVYGDRRSDDPGAYSVIDGVQVETLRADHPAEILNTVPGVNVQMNSGQEHLIAIRSPVLTGGAGQGSFLLLESGVPLRAPAFGNVNALFELHHETAEAIEVVRGPASVRYGSNAVHGLVNVIAPEPDGSDASALTASLSTLQRGRLDAAQQVGGERWDHALAASFMDDRGWRDVSGVEQQKLTARSRLDAGGWSVATSLSAVSLNQETAGFIQGPEVYRNRAIATSNPNPEAYRDAWSVRASARFENRLDGGDSLIITPFAIVQRMIFIQHFLPDQSTEKNGHDSLGVLVRHDFGSDALRWQVGVDLQAADGFLKEIQSRPTFGQFPQGVHYDFTVETLTFAGFVEADWAFAPDWRLLAGVRAESHAYDYATRIPPGTRGRFRVPPSRTDDYTLLTPKLGLTYSGFGWGQLFANYARGERAPQTSDLYRLQNLQTIDSLDVETLDSIELGARGTAGGIGFDVAAWAMAKENFFFRDADGRNVPDGATDHVGVDLGLRGDLAAGWFWAATAAWSDQTYAFDRPVANAAEAIVEGAKIDTAPEWLADASVGWSGERLSALLTAEYVGEYFTNAANSASYEGHLIAHARAAWAFSDRLEAFLIVRNLTDERYADRADFAFGSDRYFPGEPLNATLGVRLRR
jgi:outer membrane receptor protein involved in Fe transport